MSISAEPLKAPCSAIWITREFMVASTVPSTTSVSQSVISTPLSLMLGPTVSLAPLSAAGWAVDVAASGLAGVLGGTGAAKDCALLPADPSELVPPTGLPAGRVGVGSGSRLAKN